MNRFESILKARGFPFSQAIKDFEKLAKLSPEDFLEWQDKKKWEIALFHIEHNPFYKKLVGNSIPNSWEDLPIMDKATYQAKIEGLLSSPFRDKKKIYISNTSGSSGHPFFYAKDKYSHAISWALIKHRYSQVGLKLDDRQGRFYGIPLERKGYLLESIKDFIMNRVRFPVFDLSEGQLRKIYNTIVRKRIKYLYGYTSAIVLFARYLINNSILLIDTCPTLLVCIVTSEVCTAEDVAIMKKAFGVRIVNEYGSSELGVMAFENGDGQLVGSDELIFFETKMNYDGLSELLCTSLFNKAFPIIRYKIGDIVDTYNRNGRTFFRNIVGRTNDLIRLPSGKIAAGLTFYYISRSILEASGVLKEFIIRQTGEREFEFDIVSDRNLSSNEENWIRQKTELYLEANLIIKFNYLDSIKRPASGKIKHFYSELV